MLIAQNESYMQTRSTRVYALAASCIIFALLFFSFKPFPGRPDENAGGDLVNQLGFSLLGMVSVACIFLLANPRQIMSLLNPLWVLMCGLLVLSALIAPEPAVAIRAVIFTIIGIVCIFSVLALIRDADGISLMLTLVPASIILVSFAGVFLLPDRGTHGNDLTEPINSYLWRGVFMHKNIAGQVMAAFVFIGIYLMRRGYFWRGILIAIAAFIFVSGTGSKTTLALIPLTLLVVSTAAILDKRWLTGALILATQILLAILTIGSVIFDPVRELLIKLSIDETFTGRTSIWLFALENLSSHLWLGYGFEGFWPSSTVKDAANPYYLDWDVRPIIHGHNSYLDVLMNMGLVILLFTLVLVLILPIIDFIRSRRTRENILLSDMFMMIVYFCTLNAALESFFFRRIDPAWLMLLFGIFGLRLTARMVIPKHSH